MTESLIFRQLTRVRLHSDEKPAGKVGECVEIEEEVVDLILGDNIVRLHLSLIILRGINELSPESRAVRQD